MRRTIYRLNISFQILCAVALIMSCSEDNKNKTADAKVSQFDVGTNDGSVNQEDEGVANQDGPQNSGDAKNVNQKDQGKSEAGQKDMKPFKVDRVPIASCEAIKATECFSNYECTAEQRCENMGTEEDQVPCCVKGARGTKKAGTPCNNDQLECETGVCMQKDGPFLCSQPCDTIDQCPTGMKQCIPIIGAKTKPKWCMPEQ